MSTTVTEDRSTNESTVLAPAPTSESVQMRTQLKHVLGRALFWAPVWAPLIVLAQIALLGFGPALAESRRLTGAEQEMDARLQRERDERAQLERVLRAQNDAVYLERERRLLRDESSALNAR